MIEAGDHRYHGHVIYSDSSGLSWNRTSSGITAPCSGCPTLLGKALPCPGKATCSNPLLNTLVALPTDWDSGQPTSDHCEGETCDGDAAMVDSWNKKCLQNASICPSKSWQVHMQSASCLCFRGLF